MIKKHFVISQYLSSLVRKSFLYWSGLYQPAPNPIKLGGNLIPVIGDDGVDGLSEIPGIGAGRGGMRGRPDNTGQNRLGYFKFNPDPADLCFQITPLPVLCTQIHLVCRLPLEKKTLSWHTTDS